MPTFYLILSHLIADFTLQPKKLLRWKHRGWQGQAFHCFIFWLISSIFLLPYLIYLQNWLIITLLAISHYIIDKIKLTLNGRSEDKLVLFLTDQAFHIFFVFIAGYLIGATPMVWPDTFFYTNMYLNVKLVTYASVLVFITYTWDIFKFLLKHKFNPKKFYKPNYRHFTKRILLFIGIYVLFIGYRYFLL
ncbi:DUF3307 domain-containing protein [Candidatus Peregrinibacteria bacterium]|nr:DUF3307 domain-containing protein [Candidatus Peregrinibacteria bacterium]